MKHVLTLILIGVAVVMSLTVASYVVFSQFNPEREMRLMAASMAEVTSFKHRSSASWTWLNGQTQMRATLKMSGVVQQQDKTVKHEQEFHVVHVSEQGDYQRLTGILKRVDGKDYLFYQAPGPDIKGAEALSDQWIKLKEGEIELWGKVIPGLNLPISWVTQGFWNTQELQRLRTLLAQTEIFHVEWNGLTELISGQNTHIIDARADKLATEGFLLNIIRAKEAREPLESERIHVAELAGQLSELEWRFWIGTSDRYLYRLQVHGDITTASGLEVPVEAKIEFDDFNGEVTVEAPDQMRSFTSVYSESIGTLPSATGMISDMSNSLELVQDETARLQTVEWNEVADSDSDGLDDMLENFYGTDQHNPDTDADGVSDGDEVRAGTNPLGEGSLFGFGL